MFKADQLESCGTRGHTWFFKTSGKGLRHRPGPFKRPKALDGLEAWLENRLRRHVGNADVVRRELSAEEGIYVGLRTVERAVVHLQQELPAQWRSARPYHRSCPFRRGVVGAAGRMIRAFGDVAAEVVVPVPEAPLLQPLAEYEAVSGGAW